MNFTFVDGNTYKGTYISFRFLMMSESGKTKRFEVLSDSGDIIGWIQWYPRWRKYVYCPVERTVYEQVCLREIAQFIEMGTAAHKEKL